jgi:hypothetical protein
MDEDDVQKKASRSELAACHAVLNAVRSQTDDVKQQFQSDEITKQFLLEQLSEVQKRAANAEALLFGSKQRIQKLLVCATEHLQADTSFVLTDVCAWIGLWGGGVGLVPQDEKQSELRALEEDERKRAAGSGAGAAGSEPLLQLRAHKQVLAKELKTLQIALDKRKLELSDKEQEALKLQAVMRANASASASASAPK